MRISTGMIYDAGLASMQDRTASLLRTQQQLSTGRRVLRPSDDPVAAARALEVGQAQEVNANQATTRNNVKSSLGIMDGQLEAATNLMVRIRELAVQAGNAALADSDRKAIATELRERYQEFVALANSRDGNGLYLFGGFQTNNKPFAGSVESGVSYAGDDGARLLQVSGARQLAVSDSGNDIFMRIKNGNGIFATGAQSAKSSNADQVTYEGYSVLTNPPTDSGTFELRFWTDADNDLGGGAGAVYYDFVDSTGSSLITGTASATGVGGTYLVGNAYTSGSPISLARVGPPAFDYGASIVVTGTPQTGDIFDINRTSTAIAVTADTLTATGARATINAGTVSDPTLWNQTANSGDLEVRFWVDVQGTIATSGQAVGTGVIPPGLVINASNNQFNININGGGAVVVTVASNTYATPGDLATAVQTGVDAALGAVPPAAGSAKVTLDSANRLVVTLTNTGAASNLAITAVGGDSGFTDLFGGAVTATAGLAASAGRTFYDLVDATTGKSLFTGGTSTGGGVNNTFTHAYTSGSAISLSNAGGGNALNPSFDYGASVTISGIPASSDAFSITASDAYYGNGYFVTGAKTVATLNAGSGVIGTGEVTDATKWNHAANSRNLEVRFWKDENATPPVLYYDLVDAETEKSLFSNTTSTAGGTSNTYTHTFAGGDSIPFTGLNIPYAGPPATTVDDFGIAVTINGTPASGDVFKIQASQSESVFDTLGRLVTSLEAGAPAGTSGNTHLSNELAAVLANIGQIEDNFLRVRASVGSRLAEVDDLDSVGEDLALQYSETLVQLQDLDYADAITRLTREQMELQAAQQSFARVSQLSLFQYL